VTKVIFETAVLQSAISKAARVAPTKGSAFDQTAGIVIDVQPDADYPIIVKATDQEVFSMEWLNAIDVQGEATSWRLPSEVLNLILQKLPVGSGKQVTLERVKEGVKISQGKTRGTLYVMTMEDYPDFVTFDPASLVDAPGLVEKIQQVEWSAATSGIAPLGCVRLDGKLVMCTDRHRLAITKFEFPTAEPIMIKSRQLTRVLNKHGVPRIGTDGFMMHIMPDDHTQIRIVTYDGQYPQVERLMNRDKPEFVTVRKQHLLDLFETALTVVGSERFPNMSLYIGREEIAASLTNKSYGLFGDVLDVPGQALHPRIQLSCTPKNIIEALQNAPDDVVKLGYDPAKLNLPLYIDGGSTFESWVALRSGEEKSA
jgi:DNA polymerase III sliding clamp (beta) subunit (PCNA family)